MPKKIIKNKIKSKTKKISHVITSKEPTKETVSVSLPTVTIDVTYNEIDKCFEIWSISLEHNTKALLMIQTHEQIFQALKGMILRQYQAMGGQVTIRE